MDAGVYHIMYVCMHLCDVYCVHVCICMLVLPMGNVLIVAAMYTVAVGSSVCNYRALLGIFVIFFFFFFFFFWRGSSEGIAQDIRLYGVGVISDHQRHNIGNN